MVSAMKLYGLLMLMAALVNISPARATDLMGEPSDNWDTGSRESRFASLDEERFQMECDYLGIGGERKDQARKLFERLMAGRERIIDEREKGGITRAEAIARIDSLDVEYYGQLKESVKGRRNLERLERMIRKAVSRSGDDSSAPGNT